MRCASTGQICSSQTAESILKSSKATAGSISRRGPGHVGATVAAHVHAGRVDRERESPGERLGGIEDDGVALPGLHG